MTISTRFRTPVEAVLLLAIAAIADVARQGPLAKDALHPSGTMRGGSAGVGVGNRETS